VTTEPAAGHIAVELVYALPARYWSVRVSLPTGATVAMALAAARWPARMPAFEIDPQKLAIFSRPAELDTVLRDGDRVEILRPLLADPKQARRARAATPKR
jgi:hypothetical protein